MLCYSIFRSQCEICYFLYILQGFKTSDIFRLSYSIAFDCSICPFLDLFYSWLIHSIFPDFPGRLPFSLPSGFLWIIIFVGRVGSILSTWPYQISCFPVMSYTIISCEFIFPLIYSFIFLSSLEILADRLNSSISVALILLLSSSYNLQIHYFLH